MKRLIAGVVGALGVGAFLARRRRRRASVEALGETSLAEELRARLAESRAAEAASDAAGDAPSEAASAEPPITERETDLEARRNEVHERARGSIDELGDSQA